MKHALFALVAVGILAGCGESGDASLPKSLADAKLAGRQWGAEDFKLAARVSMKVAMAAQPALRDAWKRGDAMAALDASNNLLVTISNWNEQQDPRLVARYRPCNLAMANTMGQAIALVEQRDFEGETTRFNENRKACLAI